MTRRWHIIKATAQLNFLCHHTAIITYFLPFNECVSSFYAEDIFSNMLCIKVNVIIIIFRIQFSFFLIFPIQKRIHFFPIFHSITILFYFFSLTYNKSTRDIDGTIGQSHIWHLMNGKKSHAHLICSVCVKMVLLENVNTKYMVETMY